MANSKLKCTGCKARFPAEQMIPTPAGRFHDKQCMIDYAYGNKDTLVKKGNTIKAKTEKEERRKLKQRKESLRPKSWYVKEAQKWFNKFVRLRDSALPCVCCDRLPTDEIQWHAGHFLTTGARPEHRFDEDNCHKQTSYCNNHLSGNVAEYRKRLITKIGAERVERLERDHKPKNYTIDDLKEIIATYKAKCKELESNGAD